MSNHCEIPLFGAIEAGGTKFVCAVGNGPGARMLARERFATGDDPSSLLRRVVQWFVQQEARHGKLAALGVASFGPVDLQRDSPSYGHITTTPKPGWQHADVLGPLQTAFPRLPIGFDTDVNGAALGEQRWGAARGLEDFVYITAGTGIGGGAVTRGKPLHGLVHPEMGHIPLPHLAGDDFAGACPFHGRCWEGLCAGPAIARRTGLSAEQLPADHPAWDLTIGYMARALATLVCVLSPQRIVIGGSVRKAGLLGEREFFRRLRTALGVQLGGYINARELTPDGMEDFVVPPVLGDDAGICGAFVLAHQALARG